MKISPRGKRMYVVLEPVRECRTAGGLYTVDKTSTPSRIGEIKAVGEEVTLYDVGDIILISHYTGVVLQMVTPELMQTNDTHRIVNEGEVLGLIEDYVPSL